MANFKRKKPHASISGQLNVRGDSEYTKGDTNNIPLSRPIGDQRQAQSFTESLSNICERSGDQRKLIEAWTQVSNYRVGDVYELPMPPSEAVICVEHEITDNL